MPLIDLSRSELRSLVTKAARGAGLAWGLAEEAGWAADWLARRGLPAADWAALWLVDVMEGRPNAVALGVQLADHQASAPPDPHPVPDDLAAPGYLLPFLHQIATRHGPVTLSGPVGRAAEVDPDGSVRFGPDWSGRTKGWSVGPSLSINSPARALVSAVVIECLDGLALRTTVPATDQSRRDAGSSRTDND